MANENCGTCRMKIYDISCGGCVAAHKCRECYSPPTNADRIRAMSDEELAEFLCGVYDEDDFFGKFINGVIIPCYDQHSIKEWLERPVEE